MLGFTTKPQFNTMKYRKPWQQPSTHQNGIGCHFRLWLVAKFMWNPTINNPLLPYRLGNTIPDNISYDALLQLLHILQPNRGAMMAISLPCPIFKLKKIFVLLDILFHFERPTLPFAILLSTVCLCAIPTVRCVE